MAAHPPMLTAERDAPAGRIVVQWYDGGVVFIAGLLMALGVAMVYSASVSLDAPPLSWENWWHSPLRQGAFAVVGFVAMLFVAHFNYHMWEWGRRTDIWRAASLYGIAFVLLVIVLIPGIGTQAMGARRALRVPGFDMGFQPSEIAKVVLVIWVAAWLSHQAPKSLASRRGATMFGWWSKAKAPPPELLVQHFRWGFLPLVISGGLLVLLTAVEDFGTAALMAAVLFLMLLVGGARWLHVVLPMILALPVGAIFVLAKEYRRERVRSFFAGEIDMAGAGYQVHQAMLAIASGDWWGRGLGDGIQKYGYLPQDNNDFILAIICEEIGIVGGLVVIGLFALLVYRGWRIALRAPDAFGRLLAFGLTTMIGLQAAFNVAVVTHLVPTKGISLPFVSAGGSGVVFLGLATGLLAAVGRRTVAVEPEAEPEAAAE